MPTVAARARSHVSLVNRRNRANRVASAKSVPHVSSRPRASVVSATIASVSRILRKVESRLSSADRSKTATIAVSARAISDRTTALVATEATLTQMATQSAANKGKGLFHSGLHRLWKVLVVGMMMACTVACQSPEKEQSIFCDLPDEGWHSKAPLRFEPNYKDSAATYDIAVAVRHTWQYRYTQLPLLVDLITYNGQVSHYAVTLRLADEPYSVELSNIDEHGNWCGSGFGPLYQLSTTVATGVSPQQASKIVVWPRMEGVDYIECVNNVGIVVRPHIAG